MSSLQVEFRVRSDVCPLVKLTEEFDHVELRYREMAHVSGEEFLEVFVIEGPEAAGFKEAAAGTQGICEVQVLEEGKDRLVCQGIIEVPCIRSLLAQHGWIPSKVRASEGMEHVEISVKDLDEARELASFVKMRYPDFELLRITPRGSLGMSLSGDLKGFGLTPKQEEVIRRAVRGGYFDPSRKKSAREIAEDLGISRSTFTRQLRIALRKVLTDLVE